MWENHERMGGEEEQQHGKKIRPLPASTCAVVDTKLAL
jgi:hypothetical protein